MRSSARLTSHTIQTEKYIIKRHKFGIAWRHHIAGTKVEGKGVLLYAHVHCATATERALK